MQRAKPLTQYSTICRFFSRPSGCRNGDKCRFRHISESRSPSPQDLASSTNNQNPHPDHAMALNNTTTYVRDIRYYCPDDVGVFLVDGVLFRVHATQVFGSRPPFIPKPAEEISSIYLEDVLPRLSISSDSNPIMLPGITAEQFRNYLFAITSRPGDEDFSTLADRKREYWDDRLQRVCTLYVDIATLARMFGTTKLEVWAIHALHFMFTDHHETLTRSVSRIWGTDTILRLRTLSRNTELERPVASFIQYFITINLEDMTSPVCENDSRNARACMDLYDIVKKPDVDPVLLGCIFLKVLSLGHRSWIWLERMTRKDRPILYAAQVQFVNASSEIQNLEWLRPYPVCRELVEEYWCDTCESKVMATWNRLFGKLGRDLGSGLPLKDVLLLSQVAINRWRFYEECTNELENCCGRGGLSFLALPDGLLNYLDDNIQKLYEEVASRYRVLAEEV